MVLGARQFEPLVIGFAVAVGIVADHDYTRLAGTARTFFRGTTRVERVAKHDEIKLARHVLNHMVEAESDRAAPAAQSDHLLVVVGDSLLGLKAHHVGIVALLVLG